MPNLPFPVTGYVYDIDGTTKLANATVTARNVTNGEWLPQTAQGTTASDGEYAIDLGNFKSGWSDDDKIQLYVYKGDNLVACYRWQIETGTEEKDQNLYAHTGRVSLSTCQLEGYIITNSSAGGLYVDLHDGDDEHVLRIEVAAGTTATWRSEKRRGVLFQNGICITGETESGGNLPTIHLIIDSYQGY